MKIDLYKKNLYFGLIERIISIVINLALVPISLNYFGSYSYGILAIINSILAYLNIANFGIPQAISIYIARTNNMGEKKDIIEKGKKILLFYSICFTIVYFFINHMGYLETYINKKQIEDAAEIIQSISYICILFPFNLYFSIEGSIYFGFQKIYITSVINLIQIILNFILLLLTVYFKLTISTYILLINLSILIIKIIKYLYINKIILKIKETISEEVKSSEILKNGFKYLFMSISALIIGNTDNFVIAKYLGVEDVTNYSIIFKMYTILLSISYIFTGAFKPIVTEKIYEKEFEFITKKFEEIKKNLLILNLLIMIFTIYFLKIFIKIWTNGAVEGNVCLGLIFSIYVFFYGKNCLYHDFLAAKNLILMNTILMIFEGILNFVLSIFLVKKIGLNGVALGTLLATTPVYLFYKVLIKKEIFKLGKIVLDKKALIVSTFLITGYWIDNPYLKIFLGFFWIAVILYLYRKVIRDNFL